MGPAPPEAGLGQADGREEDSSFTKAQHLWQKDSDFTSYYNSSIWQALDIYFADIFYDNVHIALHYTTLLMLQSLL